MVAHRDGPALVPAPRRLVPARPAEPARPEARLLERESELQALRAALTAVGSGRGQLLLLEGHAGTGKSSLLAVAHARARALGVPVLRARASDLEVAFPFTVARRLLGELVATMPDQERSNVFSGAADLARSVFGDAARHGRVGETSGAAFGLSCLTTTLARQRSAGGLLLLVDDAHWTDEASLRFLAHLGDRVADAPVVVVLAVQPGETAAAPELLQRLRRAPDALVLRPAPLSPRAVDLLVRQAVPGADEGLSRACAQVTGGNPFHLTELLAALRQEGIPPGQDPADHVAGLVPERVLRSELARLARLPADCGRLAPAVAVLDSASLRQAAALAGLPGRPAEAAADRLATAGVLEPGEPLAFTHPLSRSAVLADLPALARTRLHRQAADLLAAEGAPAAAVAAHLLSTRPDADAAVTQTLRVAAGDAVRHGAPRAATRLLDRALAEPPSEAARGAVLAERALAAVMAAEPDAAARIDHALAELADRHGRATLLRALSHLRFAHGDYAAAADAAEQGQREADGQEPLASELHRAYVMAATYDPPLRERVATDLAPLLASAAAGHPPDEPVLLAFAATRLATDGGPADLVRTMAASALAGDPLVDPALQGIPLGFTLSALWAVEEFEAAERAATAAAGSARQRSSPSGLAVALLWQAVTRRELGRLAEAAEAAEQALDLQVRARPGFAVWTATALARVRLEQGDLDGAHRALQSAAQWGEHPLQQAWAREARGRLALLAGEPGRALTDLLDAGRRLEDGFGVRNPFLLGWRPEAALAALAAGRGDLAEQLAGEALERARASGRGRALGTALRSAGLVAGGDVGRALLEESVAVLARSSAAVDLARALVDLGAAFRHSGQPRAAREPLRRGLALAERCGALPVVRQGRDELHAAGGRQPRAPDQGADLGLTPTERRIAGLAAGGATNREIARCLHVAEKTVEWHLSSAYRKLQVRTRRQLPLALVAGAATAAVSRG